MNADTPTKSVVHLVDDDDSFCTALARLLRAAGYEVFAYSSAGAFLLDPSARRAGCLVVDVKMPGPSGLDLQEALAKQENSLPVIFLTGHGDIPTTVRAMKAGAVDFLTKPVKRDTLLAAVETALARSAERQTACAELQDLRTRLELLTPREREVLERVVAGQPNKRIAAELGTVERTVKAHRAQVMQKMRVHSVAELVHATDALRIGHGSSRPVSPRSPLAGRSR
jgi:FixJ family two-component response regulator